jgi:hypothetical protein
MCSHNYVRKGEEEDCESFWKLVQKFRAIVDEDGVGPIDPFIDEECEWCECHDCGSSIYMGQYTDIVDIEYWPEKQEDKWLCQECIGHIRYADKMLKERYTQKWIIQRGVVDTYFNKSDTRDEFRTKVYSDKNFVKWCNEYSKENNIKLRKNKFSTTPVLSAGDSWWNWKVGNKSDTGSKDPEKHKFLNPSFHYIKQLYDAEAQIHGAIQKFI